jgi:hypothetical protein
MAGLPRKSPAALAAQVSALKSVKPLSVRRWLVLRRFRGLARIVRGLALHRLFRFRKTAAT